MSYNLNPGNHKDSESYEKKHESVEHSHKGHSHKNSLEYSEHGDDLDSSDVVLQLLQDLKEVVPGEGAFGENVNKLREEYLPAHPSPIQYYRMFDRLCQKIDDTLNTKEKERSERSYEDRMIGKGHRRMREKSLKALSYLEKKEAKMQALFEEESSFILKWQTMEEQRCIWKGLDAIKSGSKEALQEAKVYFKKLAPQRVVSISDSDEIYEIIAKILDAIAKEDLTFLKSEKNRIETNYLNTSNEREVANKLKNYEKVFENYEKIIENCERDSRKILRALFPLISKKGRNYLRLLDEHLAIEEKMGELRSILAGLDEENPDCQKYLSHYSRLESCQNTLTSKLNAQKEFDLENINKRRCEFRRKYTSPLLTDFKVYESLPYYEKARDAAEVFFNKDGSYKKMSPRAFNSNLKTLKKRVKACYPENLPLSKYFGSSSFKTMEVDWYINWQMLRNFTLIFLVMFTLTILAMALTYATGGLSTPVVLLLLAKSLTALAESASIIAVTWKSVLGLLGLSWLGSYFLPAEKNKSTLHKDLLDDMVTSIEAKRNEFIDESLTSGCFAFMFSAKAKEEVREENLKPVP